MHGGGDVIISTISMTIAWRRRHVVGIESIVITWGFKQAWQNSRYFITFTLHSVYQQDGGDNIEHRQYLEMALLSFFLVYYKFVLHLLKVWMYGWGISVKFRRQTFHANSLGSGIILFQNIRVIICHSRLVTTHELYRRKTQCHYDSSI